MLIRLHTIPDGSKVWYVSTDDHQYDAADADQLVAVMRVAEHMEEDLRANVASDLASDKAVAALRKRLTRTSPPESHHYCDHKGCTGHLGIHGYCFVRPSAEDGI